MGSEIEKATLNNSDISYLGIPILIVGTLEVNSANILKAETMSFNFMCRELSTDNIYFGALANVKTRRTR